MIPEPYGEVYRVVRVDGDEEVPVTRPYTTIGAARNRRSYLQNAADFRAKQYGHDKRQYEVQVLSGIWVVRP